MSTILRRLTRSDSWLSQKYSCPTINVGGNAHNSKANRGSSSIFNFCQISSSWRNVVSTSNACFDCVPLVCPLSRHIVLIGVLIAL